MELLLFRLYGALASWGEIAVGESRHTAAYPSKSALLGLIASALGIPRDDETQQQALQQHYVFAVELLSAGQLLRDYHTTQVPDSVGKFTYRTRRDELILGQDRLGTILSSREYRTDALAVVAVRALEPSPFSLQHIQEKLLKPEFHLYLGRKSCPLAAPLNPQLITANHYLTAFQRYQHKPVLSNLERDAYWLGLNKNRHYYWEGDVTDFSDAQLETRQTRIRHDQPLSRKRWQFSPRQEHYYYQAGV